MRIIRNSISTLLFFVLVVACSKDDDATPKGKVPSGEIVALALRDFTLTGEGVNENGQEVSQVKWWHGLKNVNIFTGCGSQDDEIETDLTDYYVYFNPNGEVYQKVGLSGDPYYTQDWNWSDGTKTRITLSNTGLTFKVSFLNDENVVYSFEQTVQGSCKQIVYEQYNDPQYE